MKEAEWQKCTDPGSMLQFLGGRASDRKLRLFGCACCRRIWPSIRPFRLRGVVEVGEQFADGLACRAELRRVRGWAAREAGITAELVRRTAAGAGWRVVWEDAAAGARLAAGAVRQVQAKRWEWNWARPPVPRGVEARAQCDLLRDIFGNPFRPAVLDPAWLSWNGGVVRHLALAAYDERVLPRGVMDRGRLGILSDALEEAGCSEPLILDHLRGDGEHVRGCWAVDLLLGKG